jgi:hypothetical protein
MGLRHMEMRRYNGFLVTPTGRVFSESGRRVKEQKTSNGYIRVNMFPKSHKVHRLVALLYVANPAGYTEVNHKDGDKTNNNYENLEWCSRQQNMQHAYGTGLITAKRGENANRAKLSDADVLSMRRMMDSGSSQSETARRYKVSTSTAWNIFHRVKRI